MDQFAIAFMNEVRGLTAEAVLWCTASTTTVLLLREFSSEKTCPETLERPSSAHFTISRTLQYNKPRSLHVYSGARALEVTLRAETKYACQPKLAKRSPPQAYTSTHLSFTSLSQSLSKMMRLVHYAVDAILISAVLAGIKRSTVSLFHIKVQLKTCERIQYIFIQRTNDMSIRF